MALKNNIPNWAKPFMVIAAMSLFSVLPSIASAQTIEDCLSCHEDKSLTTEKNGKVISLTVDRTVLKKSPHAKLVCTACHTGFDPQNIPHKEKIEPVNCLTCHNDAPSKHSFSCLHADGKGKCHGALGVMQAMSWNSQCSCDENRNFHTLRIQSR